MSANDRAKAPQNGNQQVPPSSREDIRAKPPISAEERHRRIAEAAYYYALRRGGNEDRALDDWIQAEADVDQELARSGPDAP